MGLPTVNVSPLPSSDFTDFQFFGENKVRLSGNIIFLSVNLPTKKFATDVSRQIGFHPPPQEKCLRYAPGSTFICQQVTLCNVYGTWMFLC